MKESTVFQFSSANVHCYFDVSFSCLSEIVGDKIPIIITDQQVFEFYKESIITYDHIVIPSGEASKNQFTVTTIIDRLLQLEVDKHHILIGMGGGMVTDITGFVASVYKRGISCGFIPSTVMAMADAALGGKNAINHGIYKNMLGTYHQPLFILFDFHLLHTLPPTEFNNGMAEIIKHACLFDDMLFRLLEKYTPTMLRQDVGLLSDIIVRSAKLKMNNVLADEKEKGERKLLNFGHTIGHAVERLHNLPHGHAISIGMVAACALSEKLTGLHFEDAVRVLRLLSTYHLPVDLETDYNAIWTVLKADKKRCGNVIDFILLEKIGKGCIYPMPLNQLQDALHQII